MARRLVPLTAVEREPGYAWASTRWLRRQTFERRLPFHKPNGRVLIDLDDLDAYAERGRVEAVGPVLCLPRSVGKRRLSKVNQGTSR